MGKYNPAGFDDGSGPIEPPSSWVKPQSVGTGVRECIVSFDRKLMWDKDKNNYHDPAKGFIEMIERSAYDAVVKERDENWTMVLGLLKERDALTEKLATAQNEIVDLDRDGEFLALQSRIARLERALAYAKAAFPASFAFEHAKLERLEKGDGK